MDTTAGIHSDGSSAVNDKCYAIQTGRYQLDVEELQRRLTQEANAALTEAPLLEQGGIVGLECKPSAVKTVLKKGVEVALWPISKPVKGILYVQRHWEEFFWNSVDSAVRKRKETNSREPVETASKSMPGRFTSKELLLSDSSMPVSSTPDLSEKDLAALRALDGHRLNYSHLHLAHEFNTQSLGKRDEECESPSRSDGTISRLEISRSDLERRPTKDWSHRRYRPCAFQ